MLLLRCRDLPEHQKKIGMVFGVATAIILRIFFASIITLFLICPTYEQLVVSYYYGLQ